MNDDSQVTCESCGACCMHLATPPSFYPAFAFDAATYGMKGHEDYAIWESMPKSLQSELRAKYETQHEDDGPCMWLDIETRKCRHYKFRPSACREFVVPGDESCLGFREELIQLGTLKIT